jgi:divalent metal cation (Fe/Co/Zn/Cd) transporter
MNLNLYVDILCGIFCLIFGIWLFEYILRRARVAKNKAFYTNTKLYLLSVVFIIIGIGLVFTGVILLKAAN